MQAELDVPVWPGSLRTLEELRARHPDPPTDADRKDEERRTADRCHSVRPVRVGVNSSSRC